MMQVAITSCRGNQSGWHSGAAPTPSNLITEAGDNIVTEAGDQITTED